MVKLIFWLSFIFILYTYIGYPVVLYILNILFKKERVKNSAYEPNVSVVIAVYNEEKYIERRIRSLLSQGYPKDKFEIIIVSDGSTDTTIEKVKSFSDKTVKLFSYSPKRGKAEALNLGISKAEGEIIVFSDARQVFSEGAIKELVSNFCDETIGGVSGELELLLDEANHAGQGVGMYWKYEKLLRKLESSFDSAVGATGAIYAIRKELYEPIPTCTVLDDFWVPLQIILKGYRIIFDFDAKAYDKVFPDLKIEYDRKVRTLAGNYQAFIMIKELFNIRKNRVFLQFISHKVFRLLIPYALISILISNFFLAKGFYLVFLITQLSFYLMALACRVSSGSLHKNRLINFSNTFVMLNMAAVIGLVRFIEGAGKNIKWK